MTLAAARPRVTPDSPSYATSQDFVPLKFAIAIWKKDVHKAGLCYNTAQLEQA
jgi:hypothetical protein